MPPAFGGGDALSLALLFICILAVYCYRRAMAMEFLFDRHGKAIGRHVELGRWRWPGAGTGAMFALVLGLPAFTLVWKIFSATGAACSISGRDATLTIVFILSYPFPRRVKTSVLLAAMARAPSLRSHLPWPGSPSADRRVTALCSMRSPSRPLPSLASSWAPGYLPPIPRRRSD